MNPAVILSIFLASSVTALPNGQSNPKLTPPESGHHAESAIEALQAEEARGPSLFYRQEYYSGGKLVSLQGSFYTAITSVHASGCQLSIHSSASDHFSGKRGRKQVPDTWTRYHYAVTFQLSPEIANALRIMAGRPVQLQSGTYADCGENHTCTIQWLEIRSARPELKLRATTDDVAKYDGTITTFDSVTTKFLLPLSSAAAGERITADLQRFAQICGREPLAGNP